MPLEDFAVVSSDATVLEALHALEAAQQRIPEGRQLHRSVLVRDRYGRFVGKVGQRAILRALIPQPGQMFTDTALEQAGVSEEMMDISMHNFELMQQDISEMCRRACFHPVSELLMSDPETVDIDASLSDLIRIFVEHDILSVLVIENELVVGVLRLTDLFSQISEVVQRLAVQSDKDDDGESG